MCADCVQGEILGCVDMVTPGGTDVSMQWQADQLCRAEHQDDPSGCYTVDGTIF